MFNIGRTFGDFANCVLVAKLFQNSTQNNLTILTNDNMEVETINATVMLVVSRDFWISISQCIKTAVCGISLCIPDPLFLMGNSF